jgi:lysophospholipase L1-like esterase
MGEPHPERYVPESERNLRFLFQGDSITDGNRGRTEDPNHVLGHGYAFSVSSRIGADFAGAGFTFLNRGISGNTVGDLKARWQKDTLDLRPQVLSILVGINDVGAIVENRPERQSAGLFEETYRELLDAVRGENSEALFVLGLPFVFPVGVLRDRWTQWRDLTDEHAAIVRMIAEDYEAVLVDYQGMFERASRRAPIEHWIWDGVHPTVFGHELMAREWIGEVGSRLGFLEYYGYR